MGGPLKRLQTQGFGKLAELFHAELLRARGRVDMCRLEERDGLAHNGFQRGAQHFAALPERGGDDFLQNFRIGRRERLWTRNEFHHR